MKYGIKHNSLEFPHHGSRKDVFKDNLVDIFHHNLFARVKLHSSFEMGVNKFADMVSKVHAFILRWCAALYLYIGIKKWLSLCKEAHANFMSCHVFPTVSRGVQKGKTWSHYTGRLPFPWAPFTFQHFWKWTTSNSWPFWLAWPLRDYSRKRPNEMWSLRNVFHDLFPWRSSCNRKKQGNGRSQRTIYCWLCH